MSDEIQPAETVSAEPTKQFFVEMLTRDIGLQDTVMDLLDNCLDGVLRLLGPVHRNEQPYRGYWAKINLHPDQFSIEDNCGGIPQDRKNYAFRMGRTDEKQDADLMTVGVYGIGMKRAIFKIGGEAFVTSQYSPDESFEVEIPPNWVETETWAFPLKNKGRVLQHTGTQIAIAQLHPGVSREFGEDAAFINDLKMAVARYYARIIEKGFTVYVNGQKIEPLVTKLYLAEHGGIAPYVISGRIGDVELSIACGFYWPLASEAELDIESDVPRSRHEAGWTIICNDRVVLYKDTTRLTGWGQGVVPYFHNQFISFAGEVEFKSRNVAALPLTTTKRGIDAGSFVYLEALRFMQEGAKLFTSFTNRWKGKEKETTVLFQQSTPVSSEKIVAQARANQELKPVRGATNISRYKPELPEPRNKSDARRITFSKSLAEIRQVAEYFFDTEDIDPNKVGENCFDHVLELVNNVRR